MYVIRRATPRDAPEIQKLNHRNLPEKYSLSFITSLLTRPNASYLVEYRGKPVGYIIAVIENYFYTYGRIMPLDVGHIVSIAVDPEHRRKGLARRMILKALEDLRIEASLRGQDLMGTILEVRVTNEPAIRLYESIGFEVAYIRPGYYRDGETGLIMIYRYEREVLSES